ncbi:MAG: hypothetical protein U0807_11375 [Candidatus Binatia bacterium]
MPELPHGWLADTIALYGRVFRRGAELAVRNWPIGVVIAGCLWGLTFLAIALGGLGLGVAGGLVWTLLMTACFSAWLALVGDAIRSGRVRWADVPAAFGAYLGDLLTVGFLLWGIRLLAEILVQVVPFVGIVLQLATIVFFNAVPELVYLGRHPPAELLATSYRFIAENWIEWFPANFVLLVLLASLVFVPGDRFQVMGSLVAGAGLAFVLLVRGLLFVELGSQGRRARAFQRRSGR